MRTFCVSLSSLVDLAVFLVYIVVIAEANPIPSIEMPLMDFLDGVMRIVGLVNSGFNMVDDNVAGPWAESGLFFELEFWSMDNHNGWNELNQ